MNWQLFQWLGHNEAMVFIIHEGQRRLHTLLSVAWYLDTITHQLLVDKLSRQLQAVEIHG